MTATMQEPAAPPRVPKAAAAIAVSGIVDNAGGQAFVRTSGYRRSPADVSASAEQIRQYGLRKGDKIEGAARSEGARTNGTRTNGTGRGQLNQLVRVDTVNGMPPEFAQGRPNFDDLTPLYPQERVRLEDGDPSATARIIDLVAPIGKGQRGLIVSPPKAGKTMVLQAIANAIANSHPEITLTMVLIGERPEEVTDLRRPGPGWRGRCRTTGPTWWPSRTARRSSRRQCPGRSLPSAAPSRRRSDRSASDGCHEGRSRWRRELLAPRPSPGCGMN